MLLKLYKKQDGVLHYWQAWANDPKKGFVNWGVAGERGLREIIGAKNKSELEALLRERIGRKRAEGFAEAASEDLLVIEYDAVIMTANKLKKLHRLGDHLDYLLGYTGLGAFDGNGYGFGKMDVSVTVVDFEIAKRVIAADLEDTVFSNYTSSTKVDFDQDEGQER